MFSTDFYTTNRPEYKTKSEVLQAAHQNKDFFESFSESLKNAWKFYCK